MSLQALGAVLFLVLTVLVAVKLDSPDRMSWPIAFIPCWIFDGVACILCVRMRRRRRNHSIPAKQLALRAGFLALMIAFQVLLVLRLEGLLTVRWIAVLAPLLAFELLFAGTSVLYIHHNRPY
ncbi:hypothetical protein CAOG_01029 [Capsaspora owczarzaki ATCC 30864]|uniref:Transmembrane protein n=1 Tax=Capsaspora owczarzaki (strain ATCC 30864) TaxID=595528 RepID=A0A0D2U337_CAPO3|nr:hypothetical protein CAOG_01029 [Capsaspora owczarzaki ATCC 30864]KJE89586.1 hypothetical protein CAOG_001029 [Capsaspora owczarzaki ATCC 30864]|eukprot:XP_004365900.1 hypothetical protein CAOG_01029 [Capsaspora owczarzaki ATCC 30864]